MKINSEDLGLEATVALAISGEPQSLTLIDNNYFLTWPVRTKTIGLSHFSQDLDRVGGFAERCGLISKIGI